MEWGLFNDEAANWTADQAVEAGFYSREEAEAALDARYSIADELIVHEIDLNVDLHESIRLLADARWETGTEEEKHGAR